MHVYLREDPVHMEVREVEAEGLIDEESELIPVAFYVDGNERPSFRAILPPETVAMLEEATLGPVHLGVMAEEPESAQEEVHAMVGLTLQYEGDPEEEEEEDAEDGAPGAEPWQSNPDAWKGEDAEEGAGEGSRTLLLAFAPLVRLRRKFPADFAEELADLLESALSGATRPSLEARIDNMLGDL